MFTRTGTLSATGLSCFAFLTIFSFFATILTISWLSISAFYGLRPSASAWTNASNVAKTAGSECVLPQLDPWDEWMMKFVHKSYDVTESECAVKPKKVRTELRRNTLWSVVEENESML
ncbi:unnamed protein product [Anisakis simplex]|uniref:Transmembrane protein n=1 Tax=Anisakis simplex TaxID=6269 RepID=A0A0M3J2U7_ANISI|nr:unnamed protein product [Anisakis simplex]